MINAYELLGVGPRVNRDELDAAYAAKRATYAPEKVAGLGNEFERIAATRRAELEAAYRSLRVAVTAPERLAPEVERRRDWQTILALLLFLAFGLGLIGLRDIGQPQRTVSVEGADVAAKAAQVAPDFTMPALDGGEIRLADYKGKVVLINIWATWCPPCVREIPRLQRTYEQYNAQGFVLIGMNTTFQDDKAKVETFVRDQGMTYPIALDIDGKGAEDYAGRLMPTSYLIDQNGKIVSVTVGEVDEAKLKEQVAVLLKE